jgi:precorrin-6Y C5,15-methyltransferase (decarboxylating)
MSIHVLGLGVAEYAILDHAAAKVLLAADYVIGAPRQLACISAYQTSAQIIPLPPLRELADLLTVYQTQTIVLLASGDPLVYGIGRWLLKRYPNNMLHFYPAISSVQQACHALGLAWQDVDVVSLHGRPRESIRRYLQKQRICVVLTDQYSSPDFLAAECCAAGFADSTLWVCERLGYADQKIQQYTARDLQNHSIDVDPLHITVMQLRGEGGVFPEFAGMPDASFITDQAEAGQGMLTKREVRLAILSLLQIAKGDVVWDIGAGCGGVAVELAYWQAAAQIHAIEYHPARLQCLRANREKFGVIQNLQIHAGRAEALIQQLPTANKIFIGGSGGELDTLLMQTWQRLPKSGLLVASAVTEQSKQQLIDFAQNHPNDCDYESLQIAINKASALAEQWVYRPSLPVTLFKFRKIAI